MKILKIVIFCMFIIGVFATYIHGENFRRKHTLVVGKVFKCDGGGKGNFGPGIHYMYEINGLPTYGSRRNNELYYSIHDLENHFFPVVYVKTLFWYDDVILITPHDFAYFGYPFPDSLNWVLPYIRK